MPLKKILTSPEPLRYQLFRQLRKLKNRLTNAPYLYRTVFSEVERPEYGYCIYHAAQLAKALGHKRVTIIEFGVNRGAGLKNIEYHIRNIKKEIDIEFDVFGFDTSTGLPKPKDYRDLPFKWAESDYTMPNFETLQAELEFSKLIIGDVDKTSKTFFDHHQPGPIGAIFFDMDYYSSTIAAFRLFDASPEHYLPRVISFFDDILGGNEYIGELCAIKDFNEENSHKKIAQTYGLHALRNQLWCEKVFLFHDFKHPDYSTHFKTPSGDGLF